jgi:N-acetylglucosamine-6-phosphate deacetylase
MTLLFEHARKLDAQGEVDDFWMLVDGDTIVSTGSGLAPVATEAIDIGGDLLVPGFIDLHCHGGGGHSFDDGTEEIRAALATHRAHGTTRSVISLVASPIDDLLSSLRAIATLAGTDPLVLGSHLEGPYLSPARSGAHNPAFLHEPQPGEIDALLEAAAGTLRQITIAPELPNALEAIQLLVRADVVVGIGHTEASFELTNTAFDCGARLLTHAFNGMPAINHQEPGPIIAAFDRDDVVLELIVDGIHVHPSVAALAFEAAPGRIALVTDAMAAAGGEDGDYTLGSVNVSVRDGRAMLRGTAIRAGSTLTLDRALRVAIEQVGITPRDAVAALTETPARVLGLERHGLLAPGYVADAVRLGGDWGATAVWADGRAVTT